MATVFSLNKVILESSDGLDIGIRIGGIIDVAHNTSLKTLKKVMIVWEQNATPETFTDDLLVENSLVEMDRLFEHSYTTSGTKIISIRVYTETPIGEGVPVAEENLEFTWHVKVVIDEEILSTEITVFECPELEAYLLDPSGYTPEAGTLSVTSILNSIDPSGLSPRLTHIVVAVIEDGVVAVDQWGAEAIAETTEAYNITDLSKCSVKLWMFDDCGFFETGIIGPDFDTPLFVYLINNTSTGLDKFELTRLKLEDYNDTLNSTTIRLDIKRINDIADIGLIDSYLLGKVVIDWGEDGVDPVTTVYNPSYSINQLFTHAYAAPGIYNANIKVYASIGAMYDYDTGQIEVPADFDGNTVLDRDLCLAIPTGRLGLSPIITSCVCPELDTFLETYDPEETIDEGGPVTFLTNINTGGKGIFVHKIAQLLRLGAPELQTLSYLDFQQINDIVELSVHPENGYTPSGADTYLQVGARYFVFDPRGFVDSTTLGVHIMVPFADLLDAPGDTQDITATITKMAPGATTVYGAS